ncbi:zinc finger BED domain-containing protein 4-like [Lytechinus variegatus]|uniref:zinc finger BED domain-containing protein 4-like n=1 Tax=Lytechinus variegatus TaxID=7654 RepID=UPI001BB26FC2|nr:zinc finger BED domain-containing protein 4-like [Lytechinus variegatus]
MRTLVSKVSNSHPVKRHFEELLERHYPNQPHITLMRDCETRWNSTLHMLETIMRQREAVEALANDRIMRGFNDFQRPIAYQHWSDVLDIIPSIIHVLKPAESATKLASQHDSTLSSYIPMSKGLSKQLDNMLESEEHARGVGSMLDEMVEKWRDRMAWVLKPTPGRDSDLAEETVYETFHAATILDPRYKMKYLSRDDAAKEKARMAVVNIVMRFSRREAEENMDVASDHDEPPVLAPAANAPAVNAPATNAPAANAPVANAPADNTAPDAEPAVHLARLERDEFQRAMASAMESDGSDDGAHDAPRDVRQEGSNELEVYLRQSIAKANVDPMEYWSLRQEAFPLLAPVAAAFFGLSSLERNVRTHV